MVDRRESRGSRGVHSAASILIPYDELPVHDPFRATQQMHYDKTKTANSTEADARLMSGS